VHIIVLRPARPPHRKKKTEYISDDTQRQEIGQIKDASQTVDTTKSSNKKPTSPQTMTSSNAPASSQYQSPPAMTSTTPSPLSIKPSFNYPARRG